MNHHINFGAWVIIGISICCGGCVAGSRSVSVSAWQKNVEKYVADEGHGDASVLRNVTLGDGRHGYAMLGNPVMTESVDAVGLLQAVIYVQSKPAFVYLLGVNEKGHVKEMRLAALLVDGKKLRWIIGPTNKQAFQKYLQYRDLQWKQKFPGRKEIPLEAENFPAPEDVFDFTYQGDRATAVHTASGATWSIQVVPAH